MGLAVFVLERQLPPLGLARHQLVAEAGGIDLERLLACRNNHRNLFLEVLAVVERHELELQYLVSLRRNKEGELLEARFAAVNPSLAQQTIAATGKVVDVGLGGAGANGNVGHVLVIDRVAVARYPQGIVGHGGLAIGLAVEVQESHGRGIFIVGWGYAHEVTTRRNLGQV